MQVEEAVEEDDPVSNAEVVGQCLQAHPVALAFPAHDLGVRRAGDDVPQIRVFGVEQRHRLDRQFDPLALRQETERRHDRGRCRKAEPLASGFRVDVLVELSRCTVGDDLEVASRDDALVEHQPPGAAGEHDDGRGIAAQLTNDTQLVVVVPRQHGVQRHDVRDRKRFDEPKHVLARGTTEDSELVLNQGHVTVGGVDPLRRRRIRLGHVATDPSGSSPGSADTGTTVTSVP